MCSCIKEVQESVKESNNYNLVELDCVLTDMKSNNKLTGQRIEVYYNHVKRDGAVQKKYKKSFVSHIFCPFCGIKY